MGEIEGNVVNLIRFGPAESRRSAGIILIDKNKKVCYNYDTEPCHILYMECIALGIDV